MAMLVGAGWFRQTLAWTLHASKKPPKPKVSITVTLPHLLGAFSSPSLTIAVLSRSLPAQLGSGWRGCGTWSSPPEATLSVPLLYVKQKCNAGVCQPLEWFPGALGVTLLETRQRTRKDAAKNSPVVASGMRETDGSSLPVVCVLARARVSAGTGVEPSARTRAGLPRGGGVPSRLQGRLQRSRD